MINDDECVENLWMRKFSFVKMGLKRMRCFLNEVEMKWFWKIEENSKSSATFGFVIQIKC